MEDWSGSALALITGGLFVLIGIPLMLGKVKPNRIYGYRTKITLENPEVWYRVNAVTGKYLAILGGVLLLLGLIGLAALNDSRQQEMLVWIALAVMLAGIAWTIYEGQRLSKAQSS